MKPLAFILLLALVCGGCSLVPTDGWPKLAWYWSDAAKQHRQEVAEEKTYRAPVTDLTTNEVNESVDTIIRLKAQRASQIK